MELYGERVSHKAFGKGKITEFKDNYVTVVFDDNNIEKKFIYPQAFNKFLEVENGDFLTKIIEDSHKAYEVAAEERKATVERIKLEMNKKPITTARANGRKTNKLAEKGNVAFKCNNYDGVQSNLEPSQVLQLIKKEVAVTEDDDKKIKAMSLKNISANSLAMLTAKYPGGKEKDRIIFAVYLVHENHGGNSPLDGYVAANPKYKIELTPLEAKKLKFWNYYFNPTSPEKILAGSVLQRYTTDVQSAQVLKEICKIKAGTNEEVAAKELFEYYCKLKKIDTASIPAAEGGLKRNSN